MYAVVEHIRRHAPSVSILENTRGLGMTRGTRDNEQRAERTALQWLLEAFSSDSDYTVKCTYSTALESGLATLRGRYLVFVVHKRVGVGAERVAEMFEQALAASEQPLPVGSFLQQHLRDPIAPGTSGTLTPAAERAHEAEYARHMSTLVGKAVAAKRLPDSWRLPPVADRASALWCPQAYTAYQRATLDVYDGIAKHMLAQAPGPRLPGAVPIADVSQSPDRGQVFIDGRSPTLCTNSMLVVFTAPPKVVAPAGHFALMGFDVSDLRICHLSDTEARCLTGNAMATTTMACAAVAALQALSWIMKFEGQ
jgi:hypothetical protein